MAEAVARMRAAARALIGPVLVFIALTAIATRWPALATLLGVVPGGMLDRWGRLLAAVLACLAAARLLLRALDVLVWPGLARRAHAPVPRLLTDLVAALIWIGVVLVILGFVFQMPVTGLVATSGVAIAVLGFALRDMLASLFAGVALSLEQPYQIGDWIELEPGGAAKVEEIGWLTTRALTNNGVGVVIPNGRLASNPFRNYNLADPSWRDTVEVVLDYAVRAETAERILLAAMREIPAVARQPRLPDVKIHRFDARGVVWHARYWVGDYGGLIETRHQVQKALLRHLHYAGIRIPRPQQDNYVHEMPDRAFDPREHLEHLLAEHELFRTLEPGDRKALAAGAVRRAARTGTTIVREGEPGSSLFVVVEGLLEVMARSGDGRPIHVSDLVPGSIFGEFSLLTGAPRSATVVPVTDAVTYEIDKALIEPTLKRTPELAEELSRVLAERQARTRELGEPSGVPMPDLPRASSHQLLDRLRAFFGLPHRA
ncbi:MAG TPA: mechanosensitive ion channel family protein [Geminicoccaceae bacterium]|nr:mechanosensitive ion channel family protein [Geminicoccaceae bacterium]